MTSGQPYPLQSEKYTTVSRHLFILRARAEACYLQEGRPSCQSSSLLSPCQVALLPQSDNRVEGSVVWHTIKHPQEMHSRHPAWLGQLLPAVRFHGGHVCKELLWAEVSACGCVLLSVWLVGATDTAPLRNLALDSKLSSETHQMSIIILVSPASSLSSGQKHPVK